MDLKEAEDFLYIILRHPFWGSFGERLQDEEELYMENKDEKRELTAEEAELVTGGKMIVNHNMAAINTLTQLSKNQGSLSKSLQKLSSGMKINSAADDPSGYQISERMRVQIRSLDQANYNAQNGRSGGKITASGWVENSEQE